MSETMLLSCTEVDMTIYLMAYVSIDEPASEKLADPSGIALQPRHPVK